MFPFITNKGDKGDSPLPFSILSYINVPKCLICIILFVFVLIRCELFYYGYIILISLNYVLWLSACFFFLPRSVFFVFVFFLFKHFFFLIATLFIYLFIFGCVGSSVRARAFSSCGKWGPLFIAVRGPLTVAASLVAEHRLQTRRLSSCGSRAQLLRGMWDLPRPGLEPVSPALAGRCSTTAPPGKPPGSPREAPGKPPGLF